MKTYLVVKYIYDKKEDLTGVEFYYDDDALNNIPNMLDVIKFNFAAYKSFFPVYTDGSVQIDGVRHYAVELPAAVKNSTGDAKYFVLDTHYGNIGIRTEKQVKIDIASNDFGHVKNLVKNTTNIKILAINSDVTVLEMPLSLKDMSSFTLSNLF